METSHMTQPSPQDDLPPGPYEVFKCEDERWGWDVEDKDGRLIAQNCTEQFARAIAAIPEMKEHNAFLQERVIAFQNEATRLREENARLTERLRPRGLVVTIIEDAGHYVNEKVAAEIDRLRAEVERFTTHSGALESALFAKTSELYPDLRSELDRLRAEKAAIEAATIDQCAEILQTIRLQKVPGTEGCHALMQAEEAIRALTKAAKREQYDYKKVEIVHLSAENAELTRSLKRRLDIRLNNYLCEMTEGYDDSITGFNEAWDVMRKIFDEILWPKPP
jgi:hypothetical protein